MSGEASRCCAPPALPRSPFTTLQSHNGKDAVDARYRLIYSSWTWRCHRSLAQRYCLQSCLPLLHRYVGEN